LAIPAAILRASSLLMRWPARFVSHKLLLWLGRVGEPPGDGPHRDSHDPLAHQISIYTKQIKRGSFTAQILLGPPIILLNEIGAASSAVEPGTGGIH
jgi:hypothetical protein